MREILHHPDGRLNRAAVMREAWRQFRQMKPRGWTFGRCLSFAWNKARGQRDLALVAAVVKGPRHAFRAHH